MSKERELTEDELNAVSGASLPLPAIVATIVRTILNTAPPTVVISPGIGNIRGESID
jgi:hypothetical protein